MKNLIILKQTFQINVCFFYLILFGILIAIYFKNVMRGDSLKNFNDVLLLAKKIGPKKISVAVAHDEDVLKAVKNAIQENLAEPILIGDEEKIRTIADKIKLNLLDVSIINIQDKFEASMKAVELVAKGEADIVMKGLVDTAIILKAVLNKENGLRTGNILSHVAVFETEKYHKILFVTDAAMNISPKVDEKRQILENTLKLVHSLGIENPKVAVVCAMEKVNPKMIATLDAEYLVNLNKEGKLKGCLVEGPYALDNAISKKAAEQKGIKGIVAGDADILLMPDIEAGNVLYKSLTYFANTENAGLVLGAKSPIILTSRADSDKAKLNSIALSVLYSD